VTRAGMDGGAGVGRDHLTCYYCALRDDRVEAGGIWHCPNVLCTGPGAAHFRALRASFVEHSDGRHSVDEAEMVAAARAHVDALPYRDRALAEHILASIPRWERAARAAPAPGAPGGEETSHA
jgi:ribosomal protein L37AE/L43A